MSAIQLQSLNKFYDGGVHVVKDVNLEIEDGEMVVLVGPSGCGKSTTLRMIAGLETITTGNIRIGGKVVNDLAPRDRDIAMVFQSYALYPHMSVFENMAFALKLRKVPSQEIESKVRKAAEMLDIGHLLERKPGQLSGGQRQRVALGRAIIRNPQCFLFDEPLSNLDARLRIDTRAELRRLHRRLEATAVYVTHDQEEAMTLGDRVVVMKDGIIQQVGRPLDIYDRPANRFVAGFLGSPPMNFLEGKITVEGDQVVFVENSSSDAALRFELGERYASLGQRDIVVGVRAEAIAPKDSAAFAVEHSPVQATIELIQPLGDRMTGVWNTAGGQRCVGQFEARSPVREGDQIELAFDLNRLNFFAADDEGARIELPA